MAGPIGELFVAIKADVAGAVRDLRQVRDEGTKAGNQAESSFLRGAEAAKRYAGIVTGAVATGVALAGALDDVIRKQDTLNKLASDFSRTLSGITNAFASGTQGAEAALRNPIEQAQFAVREQRAGAIAQVSAAEEENFRSGLRARKSFLDRVLGGAASLVGAIDKDTQDVFGLSPDQIAAARRDANRQGVGLRQQVQAQTLRREQAAIEQVRRQADPRYGAEQQLRLQEQTVNELKRRGYQITNGTPTGVQP